jgi:riboflavin kinase/FMN adenylyltransferase
MGQVRIMVLGSGTSVGVPMIGCDCRVCRSSDPRDRRLRPSIAIEHEGQVVLIDAGPDFREQALRARLPRIDAVLLTHAHADHIFGIDDLRPFNYRQKQIIPIYATRDTIEVVERIYSYAFSDTPTQSTKPRLVLNEIDTDPFEAAGLTIQPIPICHGRLRSTGYRFGSAAYLTDHSEIPDASLAMLGGLDVLFLDGLRYKPHPTHSHIARSLAYVRQLQPRRAYLTHICHDLPHARTESLLPPSVRLAYDGLEIQAGTSTLPIPADTAPLKVYWNLEDIPADFGPSAVAIGNFDGVHAGHREILRRATQIANDFGYTPSVLTFHPHPKKLLSPSTAPRSLDSIDKRLERLAALGIRQAVVLPFTAEFSSLSPRDFLRKIVAGKLDAKSVLVGDNFRFGHRQQGDVALLRELAPVFGYAPEITEAVTTRGRAVSSSLIRHLLTEGKVQLANRLLGYPYMLEGGIVSGQGIGSKQTVPTLNLSVAEVLDAERVIPLAGVYVTQTHNLQDGHTWPSITNIGYRPTFTGGDPEAGLSIETYLLSPLAGPPPERIRVEFRMRLREERKFGDPAGLKAQILRDVARAQTYWRRVSRIKFN